MTCIALYTIAIGFVIIARCGNDRFSIQLSRLSFSFIVDIMRNRSCADLATS
jgi:hypothetical protein